MFLNVRGSLLAGLVALGGATQVAAQSDEQMAAFLEAVKAVGCTIDEATAPVVEQSSGLDQATLGQIMTTLTTNQQVAFSADGSSVTILAGPCSQ